MRQVKILSSCSGAGKTTYARKLVDAAMKAGQSATIVSADDWFHPKGVEYRLDPSKLGEAHANCFRLFIGAMQHYSNPPYELIVIDNTSCTLQELSPYMLGASAFEYEPEIITISISVEHAGQTTVCAERNVHNVPFSVILRQARLIAERKLPPYWKETVIPFSV